MVEDRLRSFVQHIEKTAADHKLWTSGDRIVVAVSGGPDSVALLHVLHAISTRQGLDLVCAHVHHGFRKESDQEAELVKQLAAGLDIPLEMAYFDIPSYMEESGKGAQEAARDKRYEFLFRTAHKYKASSIALAHHADDQAETVLMRLLRGSGPSGLAGMRMKRREQQIGIIRPFLERSKAEIVELCDRCGFAYAVDNSNLQTKYRRNAIRLEVLPFLETYHPHISSSLNQLAEVIQQEDDFMELEARRVYQTLVRENNGRLAFEAPSFLGLHVALQRRLIKLILNYLPSEQENADFSKIESVRQGILRKDRSNWRLDLGEGITCVREYDTIVFWPQPPSEQEQYIYTIDSPAISEIRLPEIGKTLIISHHKDRGRGRPSSEAAEAEFDADRLAFPLTVRSRRPGDKMKIMGLNGTKKVKDILIDEKIPPSERSRIPIVCDPSGNIVWIPGVRRSIHAAVGQHTSRVLRMELVEM
ncbi:tRNA lysidine(34) synthetase TilS [Paenibacillus campinasensis]|uniref:tRNA(Ile)-lysidine synthase n=1 Tax=Paenibacillus campinasensis TaxID=66347 RepID=A0ABW9T852_9BACL|nr:tRNA lysidine(34) synthetase TilS [Paenibacillus campinasensis]MUG68817.1 tRNA lysidine(34) synthetase TilS [Paenibacillus campinasensis]